MLIIIAIIGLICITFMVELMYGIYHFNYKIRPIDLVPLRHYAVAGKKYYSLYKNTKNIEYLKKVKMCLDTLEKTMDVYDVRTFYRIDLIEAKKEINMKLLNEDIRKILK